MHAPEVSSQRVPQCRHSSTRALSIRSSRSGPIAASDGPILEQSIVASHLETVVQAFGRGARERDLAGRPAKLKNGRLYPLHYGGHADEDTTIPVAKGGAERRGSRGGSNCFSFEGALVLPCGFPIEPTSTPDAHSFWSYCPLWRRMGCEPFKNDVDADLG